MTGAASQRVAANVRRLRKLANLTQGNLAAALTREGIPTIPTVMSNIERALRPITVDELVTLAGLLSVKPAELLEQACEQCRGDVPAGFTCNACGATGRDELPD